MKPNKTYRVLVVEENPGDLYVIEKGFEECGFPCEVTTAASHQEALERLNVQTFHLLLSYFGTNPKEGESFVREARLRAPRSPLIILSSVADSSGAIEAGAHAFVRKVSDIKAFFAKIEGIMRFWAGVAEWPDVEQKAVDPQASGDYESLRAKSHAAKAGTAKTSR